MNRKFLIFLMVICSNFVHGQHMTIEGRQFKDENGNNFYPLVCNYLVQIINIDPNDFSSTFVGPYGAYNDCWPAYYCSSTSNCDQELRNNFEEIHALGFNTVRILQLCPTFIRQGTKIYDYQSIRFWECPQTGFYVETKHQANDDWINDRIFSQTDQIQQKLFDHIMNVLGIAFEKGLKVILVTTKVNGEYHDSFPNLYNNYLNSLSAYLANNAPQQIQATILGYDLQNEPYASWKDRSWPWNPLSKSEVCQNFQMWYNTIKSNEYYRLITLGGCGLLDIGEYDPQILSLDFYSPHLYTHHYFNDSPPGFQEQYFDHMVNRIKGQLYWLNENLTIPWIIGETGFRANNNNSFNVKDGTEYQQQQYAEITLPYTYNCGGSGYSWWNYQDDGLAGPYWGVLSCGDCQPPCNNLYKQNLHQVFETFYPPLQPCCNCPKPTNYYDPFYLLEPNILQTRTLGHIYESGSGIPIPNALVAGVTIIGTDPITNEPISTSPYTITDENGFYQLNIFDFLPGNQPDVNGVQIIFASAQNCSTDNTSFSSIPVANSVIDLHLNKINEDLNVSNLHVLAGQNIVKQGWNSVNILNSSVANGGTFEAKAKYSITVTPGFDSYLGSNTWIHTDPNFIKCDFFSGFLKNGSELPTSNKNHMQNDKGEVQLQFINSGNQRYALYPNPNDGRFTIECINGESLEPVEVKILDMFARELFSSSFTKAPMQVDLLNLNSGIYYVVLKNTLCYEIKKIVIVK